MRETQQEALRLFRDRGFDRVTVEEIAENVGMAASTVYRHFGTKENLVLWDEHDKAIDAAFAKTLGLQPPLAAIRDALVASLAPLYDTPQVHAAAVESDYGQSDELTKALRSTLSKPNKDAAPIIAGAAMLALDIALERWQKAGGKLPLATAITDAFATLENLNSLS